jgi:hypothetical protein
VKKRETDPFFPYSILPFLDFPSIRTLFLRTMPKLLGCGCTKLGIKNYPRWQPRTTLCLSFFSLPLKFKISVFGKTGNYGQRENN